MSKKSRKRNKKILAAIGIGLGAAALASKRKKDANVEMNLPKADMSKSVPTGPKELGISTAKKKTTPKVYQDSIMSGGSGTKYSDKYEGTPLRRIQNSPLRTDGLGPYDMAKGGRAGLKGGGKVKGCGKALRGFGKAMKGKR